jgi:Protein of unknown function (DUF3168)
MASIIEQVNTALAGIATGGVHYAINKSQTITVPYIVILRVVSNRNVTLQGASSLQPNRFQVDVYSKTVEELAALGTQIAAAIAAAPFKSVPIIASDLFEPETKLFRTIQDFSIWSTD